MSEEQFDLSIDSAPPPAFPTGRIVRSAVTAPGHRFVLHRAWGPGPTVLWHALNPSYADHDRDDPSVLRMIGFSFRWGFGSMSLTNWYSYVTPDPVVLRAWLRGRPFEKDNHEHVRQQVARHEIVVAAWGNLVPAPELARLMRHVFPAQPAWRCVGRTRSGAPTHPLARGPYRVPDSAVLQPWTYTPPPEESRHE